MQIQVYSFIITFILTADFIILLKKTRVKTTDILSFLSVLDDDRQAVATYISRANNY